MWPSWLKSDAVMSMATSKSVQSPHPVPPPPPQAARVDNRQQIDMVRILTTMIRVVTSDGGYLCGQRSTALPHHPAEGEGRAREAATAGVAGSLTTSSPCI